MQLIMALDMGPPQLVSFLPSFAQGLPGSKSEYYQFTGQLRRAGHLKERVPNNLGQLPPGNRQARGGRQHDDGDHEQGQGNQDCPHWHAHLVDTGAQQGDGVHRLPAQSAAEPARASWNRTVTAGYDWDICGNPDDHPGFQMDEGQSLEDVMSMTSSEGEREEAISDLWSMGTK